MPSHNKDKPWDTEDVDKWKVEPFLPTDNAGGSFVDESSFQVLFPRYREQYLKEVTYHANPRAVKTKYE